MRKKTRKLTLSKETLRALAPESSRKIVGELWPSEGGGPFTCRCTADEASCVISCQSYCYECN
jgi:hypothetical protein